MYTVVQPVGKGTYAKVYKAYKTDNPQEVVALKKILIAERDARDGIPQYILREIAMLKKLNRLPHPNVVQLIEVVPDLTNKKNMSVTLVFEFMPQSVLQYIEYDAHITPQKCRSLLHQTLQGIDFLHVNGVIHRDIKPENLLLTKEGIVKIADFGLAKPGDLGTYLTTVSVTLWYRPLEVLLGCDYNNGADIWSIGMVMCQVFTRVPLIQSDSEIDTLKKIVSLLGLPDQKQWPKFCSVDREQLKPVSGKRLRGFMQIMCSHAYSLLVRMLDYDLESRISAYEALSHAYFLPHECNCPFQKPFPPPLNCKK